ncbi:hypothetical protein Tco_0370677, partial [Tanacetum coccineum]
MVAYLEKPPEHDDFAQIVDFLNAHPIRYALTVNPTIYVSYIEHFWSTVKAKTVNNETQIHAKVEGKTIVISESSVRRDLQFNDEDVICLATNQKFKFSKLIFDGMLRNLDSSNKFLMKPKKVTEIHQSSEPTNLVAHEAVHEERGDRRKRAATTASSLEAEQDSGNIIRTQSMATINEPSPQGTSSGSGTRCQDTILGDADAQTRFETASKQSNDPPLSRVNPLGHGEDRLKFQELMEIYTKLSEQILALETTKTTQVKEIADLKKRGRSKIHGKHTSIFEDNDFDEDQFDANVDEAFEQ